MTFKEISDRLQTLPVDQKRTLADTYVEMVILNKDISEWNKVLQENFGPPAMPSDQKPSEEQKKLAEPHGGISKGQTLFKKELESENIIVMLWPWQDGEHTTLKMFTAEKIKISGSSGKSSSMIDKIRSIFS